MAARRVPWLRVQEGHAAPGEGFLWEAHGRRDARRFLRGRYGGAARGHGTLDAIAGCREREREIERVCVREGERKGVCENGREKGCV